MKKIFVTGASGFIGSAVVRELLAHGHAVLGLARSAASAEALEAAGAEVHRGSLDDPASLERGAAASDGVVHTAFVHDFTKFAESCRIDAIAIDALASGLAGTGRPLVVSAGLLGVPNEDAEPNAALPRRSEQTALGAVGRGIRAIAMRLPPSVHGDGDRAFVPALIRVARERGFSSYVGDGSNAWSAVHVRDAARAFRLALASGAAGARFHAVAEEAVPTRSIAEVIARRLGVPAVSKTAAEVEDIFGFVGHALASSGASSGAKTQAVLGWRPTERGLLADLEEGTYFDGAAQRSASG